MRRLLTIGFALVLATLALPALAGAEGQVLNTGTYQGTITVDVPQTNVDGSELQDLAGCEFYAARTPAELDAMTTPSATIVSPDANPATGAKLTWTYKGTLGLGQWYTTVACVDLAMNRGPRMAHFPFELRDGVAPDRATNPIAR
jgi:hypothetical protein